MSPQFSPDELTTVFAGLHGMLLSEQEATTAVHQLAQAAHRSIPTAAGAGVSLLREDGTRITTAATDAAVEAADALQHELGQGPCLSAWATGEIQRIDDTTADPRWAPWEAAAAESGIRSVLSVPLVHRGRSLGAMKAYATTPAAFGQEQDRLLDLLAAQVAAEVLAAEPERWRRGE